ncbi:MAG: DUF2252 domain-containing protein [Bacteroidetes bacterium]|nr:MAG: DUF2252 domain-containing protein [Bacteroidota bacterium]
MFQDKYNLGKQYRNKVGRGSHADWRVPADRPSVVNMIGLSNYDRVPELVPVRHARMSASPFVFYRATASLMARDLSHTQSSGIVTQVCGDCHLMNFGGFATPERHLILDINDFDETIPGNWEWDLKRLAVSFVLAAREKKLNNGSGDDLVHAVVTSYQNAINEFSEMNFLDLWYLKFDIEELVQKSKSVELKARLAKTLSKVNKQSHDTVFYKMTSDNMGKFSITEQTPLIFHPFNVEESMDMINIFLGQYKDTLQPDRRILFEQYRVIDVALKVVGVGSVGTRCFVVLLLNDNKEPLFLQVKEARQSVLEPYIAPSQFKHQGERVVYGQRLMQSASDIFLGWTTGPLGRYYYIRQLRDKKISPVIETMDKNLLGIYAGYCGRILAKAHSKTAQGPLICGYIGKSDALADAFILFSRKYADQTEKDYSDFMKGIRTGEIHADENSNIKTVSLIPHN